MRKISFLKPSREKNGSAEVSKNLARYKFENNFAEQSKLSRKNYVENLSML